MIYFKSMKTLYIKYLLTFAILLIQIFTYSQESTTDNWDNESWTGIRFAWGENKLKYSGEYQTRFNNNYKQLDRWYVEGAVHYFALPHVEIIPDFRYSVRTNNNEYRVGFGIIYKNTFRKFMFVNQVKGQMDKASQTKETWALREVVYLNYLLSEKWIPYIGGGVFLRHSDSFSGLQVIRAGAGVYYNFNPLHALSVNYFVGKRDLGDRIAFSGILLIQLTLKFNDEYIYMPAKYINF